MLSAACTSTWMNGARKTGRYRVMRQQDKRADWETEDKKKKEKFIKGQRMDEAKVNLRTEIVRDEWKWMLRWIRMRGEDDREEMDMGEESKERGREGVTALTESGRYGGRNWQGWKDGAGRREERTGGNGVTKRREGWRNGQRSRNKCAKLVEERQMKGTAWGRSDRRGRMVWRKRRWRIKERDGGNFDTWKYTYYINPRCR